MVRRIVLIFGYLFFSLATVYAANVPEKITISAYYPSATGAYNTVTLATIANPGDCSGGTPPLGKMYYNSTDNSLYICSSNSGTVGYQQVPGGNGAWAVNGTSLYLQYPAFAVGIGTINPMAKLDVTGQIKITGGGPGSGKVLVSDSGGLASWQTISIPTIYSYTGADQSFTVPAGITNITAELWGASGAGGTPGGWSYGASGGGGGYTKGTIPVTPGESLTVIVGQMGYKNQAWGVGYGGGASGCANAVDNQYGGGGGGYSAIKRGSTPLLVAGGGGGGGSSRAWKDNVGGGGGGLSGTNGGSPYDAKFSYGGGGGTQTAGGTASNGWSGTQWMGGHTVTNCYGGGGGGGWWGGAGGGYSESNTMAGGGGGSGYINSTVLGGFTMAGAAGSGGGTSENGVNGVVKISY